MNIRKFCFIACTNNPLFMHECKLYIEALYVPEGYEIELLTIEDAKSMAAGYNEVMRSTDAKFKIYLHQDVFIINKYFLFHLIYIFNQDDKIGLIGIVGQRKMPSSGVMWDLMEVGSIYGRNDKAEVSEELYGQVPALLVDVEAVDGLCMVTSVDLEWREDIFDGWDLYDASQSAEFLRAGYRVVIPMSVVPWCVHDDGLILSMWNYDKYRQRYLKEYTIKENSEYKISFIIAYDKSSFYEECCYYINKLNIPEGFTIDIIAISEKTSRAEVYNEGMLKSKAKYKVYLPQDTFILNPDFISDVLKIFERDHQVGLLGVVGIGGCKEEEGLFMQSEAIDGMIMITQYDLWWREDLFREEDFYDMSHSCEFRRKAYKVAVANQKKPWCFQDCGHKKLDRYDENKKIFLAEYPDFNIPPTKEAALFDKSIYRATKEIIEKLVLLIKKGYLSEVSETLDNSFELLPRLNELSLMKNILTIYKSEMTVLNVNRFMAQYEEYEQICGRYEKLKFYLRRVEYFIDTDAINYLKEIIREGEVTEVALTLISQFSCESGNKVMKLISSNS